MGELFDWIVNTEERGKPSSTTEAERFERTFVDSGGVYSRLVSGSLARTARGLACVFGMNARIFFFCCNVTDRKNE